MKNYYSFLILLIVISCTTESKKYKTLDFKSFQIEVPAHWKRIKLSAIDSSVGRLVTKDNDTIGFDLGPYSNSLEENPSIIDRKVISEILKEHPDIDTTEFFIVENRDEVDPENFKQNKIQYKKIDGYNTKIVTPKQYGKGITGIYIDSLRSSQSEKLKFNLYGRNLKRKNQEDLLKAIETLQFKD